MVQVPIRQKYPFDGRISLSIRGGLKFRSRLDLAREIGRSVYDEPTAGLDAQSD
jgi:hypothetical protein